MDPCDTIRRLIEPSIEAMGFELVRVRFSDGGRQVLQIMAERPDGTMTVEDCAEISRAVSALLDVEDPIEQAYDLEVSSPGIDRPLTRPKDFVNWAGFEAKIETNVMVEGRRRFRGRLLGMEGDDIKVELDDAAEGEAFSIPFSSLKSAKLVLTDDLIDACVNRNS